MLAKYDKFNKKRRPAIILCNPDGSQLYSLVGIKDTQITLRYNDVSEFSFKAYSHRNGRSNVYYKLLTSRRRVLIKDVGMFIITKVIEVGNEKTVQCKSLEHMATEIGFYLEEGTYKFYEAVPTGKKTIVDCILEKFVGWEIGGVDSSLWDLHRTFDVTDKSLYDFVKGDVEKAYNCIFIFDTINKTITIKDGNKSANKTNISLSSKNLIKEAEIEELSEDVITALNVYGAGDLTIRSVNPLGSTIYDFSYYKTSEWMNDDLINAITVWENKVKASEASFKGNLNNIKVHNKELITLNTTLKELENRLSELETLKAVRLEQGLDTADINSQIETKKSEIANQKELIKNKKVQIDALTKNNNSVVQDNSFSNNFTKTQYEALQAFIKIGKYQNTKFVVSDSMTDVEKQEITEELFTTGKAELSRLVEPRYNCKINAINFTELIKYKKFTDELELGCQITVRLDNGMLIYPTLLEINFSYDDVTELELGFSNKLSMNKSENTIGDVIKDASNTSNDVVLNRDKWNQGLNAKNQLTEYMNNSLNASLQDIVNSDYQDIVIDGSGIRCRRFDPEKGDYDKEMMWITGKSLVFSDDQFQTAKTALGMITLPDGTKAYGLNTEVLMGKLICSSQLIIENEGGTFLVDGEGVTLINAKLIIRNEDGSETTVDKELNRVEDKSDMLLSDTYDGFFVHDKRFWSDSCSGHDVKSTDIGKIVNGGISGGKALEIQGEHILYAKNAIPVETNRIFKFILKIKQKRHATTSWPLSKWKNTYLREFKLKTLNRITGYDTYEMMIGAGCVCLDSEYNIVGDHKYFVANDKLIKPSDGWVTLEGIITGIGKEQNKFAEGVKYIRPFFIVNKPKGNGVALVDSFVIKDITEGNNAQNNVDKVEGKLDNVLTLDGNVSTSKLEGTLNSHVNSILSGANMQLVMDKDGIWAMNNPDKKLASKVVAMNENGIVMAKERVSGQLKWRTAISAEGINADEINTGTLRALNMLGCNFEVSNERGKVLINPKDGIKIQKKSGSTWNDTLYMDMDGDAVFKGKLVGNSLNINNSFTVDRSGNCIAKSIKISGANSELDAKDMVVRNLVVGQNVIMGDNAKITWGNLPDDVAGMADVPSDSKIKGLALNEVEAKLGITHTTIGKAFIESPSIRGGYMEGGEITQTSSSSDSWGNCQLIGGRLQLLDKSNRYLGSIMGDNSDKKLWIEGMNALKLQSYEGDISINAISKNGNTGDGKIYLYGHVVVVGGKITDENGNPLAGGNAVFG